MVDFYVRDPFVKYYHQNSYSIMRAPGTCMSHDHDAPMLHAPCMYCDYNISGLYRKAYGTYCFTYIASLIIRLLADLVRGTAQPAAGRSRKHGLYELKKTS